MQARLPPPRAHGRAGGRGRGDGWGWGERWSRSSLRLARGAEPGLLRRCWAPSCRPVAPSSPDPGPGLLHRVSLLPEAAGRARVEETRRPRRMLPPPPPPLQGHGLLEGARPPSPGPRGCYLRRQVVPSWGKGTLQAERAGNSRISSKAADICRVEKAAEPGRAAASLPPEPRRRPGRTQLRRTL
ncbi:uncharacterized protein LOC143689678 isoform X1 [Tamandua tetradactyla]|uniref:uncharacterized protein LOC143689678 isoform X1 n=1 Tax=Tamandua tetradactyla TaxID=48850 RepID=UPI004053E7BD